MLVETFNSTAKHENIMELDNSIEQLNDNDGDDENNRTTPNEEFPPLPTDIDIQSSENTSDTYDNRQNTMDLFYCPSPPLPSPPPPSSTTTTASRKHRNSKTFTSIRTAHTPNQSIVTFSTQYRKKARAPIVSLLDNIYVNLPRSFPTQVPPISKSVSIPNEVVYATLLNTSSLITTNSSDQSVKHVEYQQIQHKSKEVIDFRIYENIPCRRPPPPPSCESIQDIPQRPTSWSIIPLEDDQSSKLTKTNEHVYINLEYQNDQPPILPKRTTKTVRIASPPVLASPPPPAIPPRQDLKDDIRCSSSSATLVPTDKDQDMFETSSNASTLKTVKDLSTHIPSQSECKSPSITTTITTDTVPSFLNARQRRALQSARRRRLRGSVALRNPPTTLRQQTQRSNNNTTVRHPMVTDDRWRRTLHKRRRQRALQMKLDGNVLHPSKKSIRPISDHTYNEIRQPISGNNRIHINGQNGQIGGVLERAMQFNGALRDRVFSWYKGANQTTRELRQEYTSENGESNRKNSTVNGDDDDDDDEEYEEEEGGDEEEIEEEEIEEDEEEEEFVTHDTFEDFLLRRRPKSSNSTTTVSGSSTIVSQPDVHPQRLPTRSSPPNKKSQARPLPRPPVPPAVPPPPIPPTPPPARRLPGLALGLDKTDVDFIHSMLQRTRGDHRVWNRITALKEAYIRATSKKHDQPKKPKFVSNPLDKNKKKKELMLKHSFAATKIRAELEKYDELPARSPTVDDEYDETCSVNFNPPRHHRSVPNLPRTPSTTHRLMSFVTSIKKRAQNNVQQLQKNLHDIRSRVHVESMMISAKHMNTLNSTRQKQILKDVSNSPRIRRTNSHHYGSSKTIDQHRFTRTQSNASQIPHQQRQQRSTNGKPTHRSPSLTVRPIRQCKDDQQQQRVLKKTT